MRYVGFLCLLMIVVYFANSPVLQWLNPDVSKDCEHYAEFVRERNIVYEFMLLTFSLIIYFLSKGFSKSIISFLVVMTAASFIDKAFFKITSYLYSDLILIGIGIYIGYLTYKRECTMKSKPLASKY